MGYGRRPGGHGTPLPRIGHAAEDDGGGPIEDGRQVPGHGLKTEEVFTGFDDVDKARPVESARQVNNARDRGGDGGVALRFAGP